jgi:hypothetical protein
MKGRGAAGATRPSGGARGPGSGAGAAGHGRGPAEDERGPQAAGDAATGRRHSPNLNLIERLWRFVKRKAAYGRYHPTFADFRAAVQDVLNRVPTTHAEKLASLMTSTSRSSKMSHSWPRKV